MKHPEFGYVRRYKQDAEVERTQSQNAEEEREDSTRRGQTCTASNLHFSQKLPRLHGSR